MSLFTYVAKVNSNPKKPADLGCIDADTIDVLIDLGFDTHRKERIRLAGIDGPEKTTAAGKALKAAVIEWVREASGTLIVTTAKDPNEKFGRTLGIVRRSVDGESLNELLVRRGLAVEYMGESKAGIWTEQRLAAALAEIQSTGGKL
jgi:micrococcal nuclease